MGFGFWFLGVNLWVGCLWIQSTWSVLTIILSNLKGLWSSSGAQFHPILMISSSCPHPACWPSPIHLSWASDQRSLFPRIQEFHTLFLYFFQVILMVTSSVSEHMNQSPEADSISEMATFTLDASESDEAPLWLALLSLSWSPVLIEVPTTVQLPGWAVALFGLESVLLGSCLCGSVLDLASSANLGVSSSTFVELCSLLTSTSWE